MKKINYRLISQIFFFLLIGIIVINKSLSETGAGIPFLSTASLHALCPFGGVETLVSLFSFGVIVKKVHASSIVLMVIVFILALLLGAVFCGWICPLGSIQEWMSKLGRKIFKSKYNHFIPKSVDGILKYGRYVVLGYIIYGTTMSLKLIFEEWDPYYALYNFWTGEVGVASIIFLLSVLVASLFIERPWCRYLCPYGAVLGWFNKMSIFKIRRNKATCIGCKKCDYVCPMNIDISTKKAITDIKCIRCLKCTSENACPVEETLELRMKERGDVHEAAE